MTDISKEAVASMALGFRSRGLDYEVDAVTALRARVTELEAENARLTDEMENANNEFGSQTANWPNLWKRIAALKELSNSRWKRVTELEAEVAFQKKCRAEEKAKILRQRDEIKANGVSIKRLTAERDGLQRKVTRIEHDGPEAHTALAAQEIKIVHQRDEINRLQAALAAAEQRAAEARADERERCAKVAEAKAAELVSKQLDRGINALKGYGLVLGVMSEAATQVAAAIRAGGEG